MVSYWPDPEKIGLSVLRFITAGQMESTPKSWLSFMVGVLVLILGAAIIALLIVILAKIGSASPPRANIPG